MDKVTLIKSDIGVIVCLCGEWIYKISESTENEYRWMNAMCQKGYAPVCTMLDGRVLKIAYLGNQIKSWSSVTDKDKFLSHRQPLLDALREVGVRHGDLTKQAIIVVDNKPMVIDFAQSREIGSNLPDKRPEGDEFWLTQTMNWIIERN